jgi:hypothetical protein
MRHEVSTTTALCINFAKEISWRRLVVVEVVALCKIFEAATSVVRIKVPASTSATHNLFSS